jgi:hypothetical protein
VSDNRNITASTPVPFGRRGFKGKPLGKQPASFLNWLIARRDTDLHLWALAAEKVIQQRARGEAEAMEEQNLEAAADAFLIAHGQGHLATRRRSKK